MAATAADLYPDLVVAAAAMAREGEVIAPDRAKAAAYERDYRVFLAMQEQRSALDAIQ